MLPHVDAREGARAEQACGETGVVLDTIGGALQRRALKARGKNGLMVSIVEPADITAAGWPHLRSEFFIFDVRASALKMSSRPARHAC